MSERKRIAVAGATGRVGRHVVDVLAERGHEVVSISRTHGVDVITGVGLADALAGVECIVDTATGPSPDRQAATEFFVSATSNMQSAGTRAGVQRIIVVSIINTDRMQGGYAIAKVAHERAMLAGPVPARQRPAHRGGQRPRRRLRERVRRSPARTGRDARRPHVRGVAGFGRSGSALVSF